MYRLNPFMFINRFLFFHDLPFFDTATGITETTGRTSGEALLDLYLYYLHYGSYIIQNFLHVV